jgi:hypothetical protein
MTLSPWVLLVAVAGCSGLMFGGVGAAATSTDSSSSSPNLSLFAKHYLQQQHGIDVGKDTADSVHRRLQTRACGDEIGRVKESELVALASFFLSVLLDAFGAAALLGNTLNLFTSSLRYDLVAYKVCGSCAEAEAFLSDQALSQDESVFGSFSSYCASDKYGYSAQHSALVFVPVITENTTETTNIVEGSLRSFVSMHLTRISVSKAPTEFWPTNLTEDLTLDGSTDSAVALITDYTDYLASLVAASSGVVTIMPDYIGYGASLDTHNRTYGYPPTYMQAAVTTWMATKQAIEEDTYGWSINDNNGGCTVMDSVVSLAGKSEGGYAAVAAAHGMQQAGVRVLSVDAGATSLDPGENLEFAIGTYRYVPIYYLYILYDCLWILFRIKTWTVSSPFCFYYCYCDRIVRYWSRYSCNEQCVVLSCYPLHRFCRVH